MFGRQSKYIIKIKGILLLNTNGHSLFPKEDVICSMER